ncbi:XPG-like endonuclease isoform X3 [Ptiloglossa arizonensis]|uniref:XPG-like endonuclease isoform X3 n=1 Tax=Ptiloglossa arizonensis TaxID=3350558 RepID=UPI003FA13567
MEELLIEKVRMHEVLYNMKSPNYRDQNIRQAAWDDIGRDFKMKAETVKDNWDKLRRCFLNAINRRRNKKSGHSARKISSWKYEQQMSFLLPFIDIRRSQSNVKTEITQDNQNHSKIDSEQEFDSTINETHDYMAPFNTTPQASLEESIQDKNVSQCLDIIKQTKRDECDNSVMEMMNIMKENANLRKLRYEGRHERMDDTDMFFLSMASLTKTLPLLEQAQIKLQLSNAVLQAQIKYTQNQPHYEHPPLMNSASESTSTNYDRNLYFRTSFLLLQGISPVFVLEGKAPNLKHNTIARRNDVRRGFRERKTIHKGGRSQFNRILNECKEMLKYMGLACVQGYGEAEAMCAYLNEDGLVDGCISQDTDCFLYGAKVVYRNFCMSAQGNRGGTGGAVDEYNIEKIKKLLDLGRNKMIVLALLCGCDYNEGLNGIGKTAALNLFKIVNDEEILERIRSWKTDNSLDQKEVELLRSNICSSCGHNGKVQKHAKSGCVDCGTVIKCNNSYGEKRALILNEIALRKKVLLIEDFPNQELIDEFLIRKDPVPKKIDLQWKQPHMSKLIDFMEQHLSWEPQYAFKKIFPLVTRWQLLHLPNISVEDRLLISDLFIPEVIKKIRNIRSVACYEINWQNEHNIIEKLKEYIALDKENSGNNVDNLFELTSIEPQSAVQECYPELVEVFENTRNAKRKKRTIKNKAQNGSNFEGTKKGKIEKRRRQLVKNPANVENNRKIDEYIYKTMPLLEESFGRMSITPKRSKKSDRQKENQENNSKVKRDLRFEKVLQSEKINSKLNNTLDRMFNELSPDDFKQNAEERMPDCPP